MTQKSCWLAPAALLLALAVVPARAGEGISRCSSGSMTPAAVQESSPCEGVPILSKIPYLNRLFRNCPSEDQGKCGNCPCKEEKEGGCCCEKEKGNCPCKKSKAVKSKRCPAPCCPMIGMPAPPPPMPAMPPMPPPMAYAPCPPMPYTPSMMPPYGQPIYLAPPAPPAPRRYMVEVRVVESNPGEQDTVLAAPRVAVTEGGSGCVTFVPPGVGDEEQVKMTVENNVYVMVRSARPGWAYVEVAVEEVDREKLGKKGTGLVEYTGSIHIARKVKLGKTVKVPWKEAPDDDKPACRVEMKVKELPTAKTPSVVFDCPDTPNWAFQDWRVCPDPRARFCDAVHPDLPPPPPAPAWCEVPAPAPIAQAAYSVPAPMPMPCTTSPCDRTVRFVCVGDCLRYFSVEQGMKCLVTVAKDTDLAMPGCGKLKVFAAANNRVRICGSCMKAFADRVTACSDGNLTLEGNVRLKCADCKAEVRADKVHVLLRDGKVKIDLDPCQSSN
jgi:hypothetical protein